MRRRRPLADAEMGLQARLGGHRVCGEAGRAQGRAVWRAFRVANDAGIGVAQQRVAVEGLHDAVEFVAPYADFEGRAVRLLDRADGTKTLRQLLAENPAALEPGLAVYRDADGTPLGAGYASGVGDIDLLASSDAGDLVVVMISEDQGGEELVAEVLQRIGWVRKHVSGGKNRVRGIVLCEQAPDHLSYTATAVADTVRFKTYRVALSFEDLKI